MFTVRNRESVSNSTAPLWHATQTQYYHPIFHLQQSSNLPRLHPTRSRALSNHILYPLRIAPRSLAVRLSHQARAQTYAVFLGQLALPCHSELQGSASLESSDCRALPRFAALSCVMLCTSFHQIHRAGPAKPRNPIDRLHVLGWHDKKSYPASALFSNDNSMHCR